LKPRWNVFRIDSILGLKATIFEESAMLDSVPFDYNDELNRRIDQFARWMREMRRRHRLIEDWDCFLIFDEDEPEGDVPTAKLSREKSLVCAGGVVSNGWSCDGDDPPQEESADNSHDNGRFVQFAFEADLFYMELPNTTLTKAEAERIMRDRHGFFWLKDNPGYAATRLVKELDPLTKFYLNGDEQRAAEDVAYIFFQQWKFPADCTLFIKAACFADGPTFEWGLPIR
jgi:hypothetical protein